MRVPWDTWHFSFFTAVNFVAFDSDGCEVGWVLLEIVVSSWDR